MWWWLATVQFFVELCKEIQDEIISRAPQGNWQKTIDTLIRPELCGRAYAGLRHPQEGPLGLMLQYFEELKREPNTGFGPKDIFFG
ncbi:MAG: hypothetical protein QNK29_07085 [Desulfobacterales bacterium]|nr:hypothetical protein [Desulfobacterales bacterium]MDX2511713.1 hypothetical protein [Desulfobacterales bacterium]